MEFKNLYLGESCADNGAFSHFVFVDDEGNQIGIFCDENASFCTEQEKAYAKLFAAAPEMYETLKKVIEWDADNTCSFAKLMASKSEWHKIVIQIIGVLQKARGEK